MPLAKIPTDSYLTWEKRIPYGGVIDRDSLIVDLCRGRSVLHIGAADAPFHIEKAKLGTLLHQKVRAVTRSITGIDADEEAVAWLRKWHGIDDIKVTDISGEGPGRTPIERYDVILCCDVLEHVGNLDGVLQYCRAQMQQGTTLLLTTINATSAKAALRALLRREAVHPDHICYFSYGTLCMLLHKNGLKPQEFGMFSYPTMTKWANFLFGCVNRLAPAAADGVLITATLKQ